MRDDRIEERREPRDDCIEAKREGVAPVAPLPGVVVEENGGEVAAVAEVAEVAAGAAVGGAARSISLPGSLPCLALHPCGALFGCKQRGTMYSSVAANLRRQRFTRPRSVDYRDVPTAFVTDTFYYTSRPDYVVDVETGETNAQRLLRYDHRVSSGPAPTFCQQLNLPNFDANYPSGLFVAVYPLLRLDSLGRLQALFDEWVTVVTRALFNTETGQFLTGCQTPNLVFAETYIFSAPQQNQTLIASVASNEWDAERPDDYTLSLGVESATGYWQEAQTVLLRHFNAPPPADPALDQFRQVRVLRGRRFD